MSVLRQQMHRTRIVDRMREQVALAVFATQHLKLLILFLGLDSFRDYFHTEVAGECRDCSHDGVVAVGCEPGNKRAVDLQVVQWETVEITERRVACAEVVDTQLDAKRTQLLEHQRRSLSILHYHALRDLEFQAVRIQLAVFQRLFDSFEQIRLFYLSPRQIHAQGQRPMTWRRDLPVTNASARLCQHPLTNRNNQTRFFSDRNEVGGQNQTS